MFGTMLNKNYGNQHFESISKRLAENAAAKKDVARRKQQLETGFSPIEADEKENSDVQSQMLRRKGDSNDETHISEPLQSNRQQSHIPVLPPVDINSSKKVEPIAPILITPKSIRHVNRRKPPPKQLVVNFREIEKQRFASAMASSTGTAVLGCNTTPIHAQTKESNFTSNMPMVSPRQLEIDRLASLFERSEESHLRNSKLIVDEHARSPAHYASALELPTSCQVVCPSFKTNCDCDHRLEEVDDEIRIEVTDSTPTFYGDSPKSPYYSFESMSHPTINQGNETPDRPENDNFFKMSSRTVPGNVLLGIGEHEIRRSQLLKERRKEYSDFMKQARLKVRNQRGEPQISCCSHNMLRLKDISTQTDDDPPNPYLLEPDVIRGMGTGLSLPTSPEYSDRSRSPIKSPRGRGNLDLHKSAYCFPGISPSTPVFDTSSGEVGKPTSEMYIRQYQYREELRKQIEERQKLESERKERERLEEEAIEKRVREQQERLRRQYEIEEQERLDYIMRRHIQDDVLRQRLADIQQHESKPLRGKTTKHQQCMHPVTVNHDVCRIKPVESSAGHCAGAVAEKDVVAEAGDPVSIAELIDSAESALKAPLLDVNGKGRTTHVQNTAFSAAPQAPPPPPLPPPIESACSSSPCRRQADLLLREPLLSHTPDDSLPVLKAVSPCVNVPTPKPRSHNAEILDNKWKVPAVEKSYIQPRAPLNGVESSPSDNVLTQLSSFRRQLQVEHFRLIERMHQQSKRRSP